MKPGTEVTVTFLPELAPTRETRAAAFEVFERQTGTKPKEYFIDDETGVWGFIAPGVSLLFQSPQA